MYMMKNYNTPLLYDLEKDNNSYLFHHIEIITYRFEGETKNQGYNKAFICFPLNLPISVIEHRINTIAYKAFTDGTYFISSSFVLLLILLG